MDIVLKKLKEITSAVMYAAEATDVEAVLKRIATIARDLAGTRYAAMGVPDGDGGLRYFKTSGMTPEEIALLEHLPQGHGLIGAIMKERQPIRLERMQDDPRSVGFPENHPPMVSLLGVPIQQGQHLFGVMYLCDKVDGSHFTDDDQQLIETMASYAALTIAGAELTQHHSRLKLLDERQRIAMQLHDGIIQSLYGVGMQIELLRLSEEVKPQELSPVIDNLNNVIEDIRAYILDLSRHSEHQRSIRQYIEHIKQRLVIPKDVTFIINSSDDPPPFTNIVFESICLIVNEAVSNAIRHADATEITISTNQGEEDFTFRIHDNGQGFDLQQAESHNGLGLNNMQQRARLHGGRIEILSNAGKGTEISIHIPMSAY